MAALAAACGTSLILACASRQIAPVCEPESGDPNRPLNRGVLYYSTISHSAGYVDVAVEVDREGRVANVRIVEAVPPMAFKRRAYGHALSLRFCRLSSGETAAERVFEYRLKFEHGPAPRAPTLVIRGHGP